MTFLLRALKVNKKKSFLIEISGIVQGIGFRPKIYNLAEKHNLSGYVFNTGSGVKIAAEGLKQNTDCFICELKKLPSLKIKIKKTSYKNYKTFEIKKSSKTKNIISDFPADAAICTQCKQEILSPSDRRYHYPFTNCTQCGPRYSIVKKLPYDRKNTVMKVFKMCKECSEEYKKPSDRRFHAQPDACSECGPKVKLTVTKTGKTHYEKEALSYAAKMLDGGKIIALKSIGGYHLACSAYDAKAILRLRKIKNRDQKPFAVMAKNIETAKKTVFINKFEEKELNSKTAPIVLLEKKDAINKIFNECISKNNKYIGVMMPYTPVHCILFDLIKTDMLIMTSANKNDKPIIHTENKIYSEFSKEIDAVLSNDREILNPVDDSIVSFFDNDKKIIIRRSRGFVPEPVNLEISKDIFAAGADLKNSFCLTRKNSVYLSPYCGDMIAYENIEFMSDTFNKMKNFLDIKPEKAVCDMHPGYNTTAYCSQKFKNIKKIQHHYAHIASVIAENNLKGAVLGFSYDGTGYGYDGKIWGSECILFKNNTTKRLCHFEYFDMPGGDAATKQIWRLALSLLNKHNKISAVSNLIKKEKLYNQILSLLNSEIKNTQVCSAGRYLDAMAAICGISNFCEYEGQTAALLESLVKKNKYGFYPFDFIHKKNNTSEIQFSKTIEYLLKDLKSKVSLEQVSGKIHETICRIILKQASFFCKKFTVNQIALSGGVFQNKYILSRTIKLLEKENFKVFYNKLVPINDGGISLGQAYMLNKKTAAL